MNDSSDFPQSVVHEVLNTFFASVFNSKTSCSLGTQLLELEDKNEEQNEAPIIQREMVSNLLHCLNTHMSMELDGIHPRVLRELGNVMKQVHPKCYHMALAGQPDDQAQSAWVSGRQVLLD